MENEIGVEAEEQFKRGYDAWANRHMYEKRTG